MTPHSNPKICRQVQVRDKGTRKFPNGIREGSWPNEVLRASTTPHSILTACQQVQIRDKEQENGFGHLCYPVSPYMELFAGFKDCWFSRDSWNLNLERAHYPIKHSVHPRHLQQYKDMPPSSSLWQVARNFRTDSFTFATKSVSIWNLFAGFWKLLLVKQLLKFDPDRPHNKHFH